MFRRWLNWFTGDGQMSADEVLAMGRDGVVAGINEIGVDETTDIDQLADDIMAEANAEANE